MFKNKFLAGALIAFTLLALLGAGFLLGYRVGSSSPRTIVAQGVTNIGTGKPDVDFGIFWQAWKLVSDEYLRNGDVTAQTKVYGAVNGLISSLGDPYTQFFPPVESQKFQEDVRGNFGGIGAELGFNKDNVLTVIAPLPDTPAMKAGLLPGDEILSINATSTSGMPIEQAVRLIRGKIGTTVVLTAFRSGWTKPKDLTIMRENIMIPTIDTTSLNTPQGKITHLSLHSFNSNASYLFYQAMLGQVAGGSKGLILDLRGDPGGFLQVAVDLAGWFVPKGSLVVSEKDRTGQGQDYRTVGNEALLHFPVVILIDKGSASASEILAGALRDIRHIKLVGEKSFGKGTVQQLEDLGDGSSVKITIAHWVLPSGHILDHDGLDPDFPVTITDKDIAAKHDSQFDKATQVITSEIANGSF